MGTGFDRAAERSDEIFNIQARRCKRCGGLLTSAQAIKDGYGACCLRKMKEETQRKEAEKDQFSLFGEQNAEEE